MFCVTKIANARSSMLLFSFIKLLHAICVFSFLAKNYYFIELLMAQRRVNHYLYSRPGRQNTDTLPMRFEFPETPDRRI